MALSAGSSSPVLSIVTPLFNCLALTRAMVASLRESMPRGIDYEVILVDDGSTDGTRDWLTGLGRPFRAVLNERNLGFAGANNRGAAVARGEWLALLNNDLVLRPGWLEPMLAAQRSLGPRAGVVGNVQLEFATGAVDHAGIFINHKGKPEHDRARPGLLERAFFPVRPVAAVTGACLLLSAELWRRLDGFDEGYVNGGEDVDLCLRARSARRLNAVAVRSVVRHHVSASPGRKRHDEENAHRLARRWREELARLGQYDWTRDYFENHLPDPRDFPDPREAWHMVFYLRGWCRRAPPAALPGMREALDVEFARWQSLGLS